MAQRAKAKVRRSQGRPDTAAAVGRQSVITAVRKALTTTPPGEITFHQVADLAGVDQRLIRYYFGTLPQLLKIVAREVTEELRTKIEASNAKPGSARDHIRMRVGIFLHTFGSNPHYHRLVVENLVTLDRAEQTAAFSGLRDSIAELSQLLGTVGKRGKAGDIDARLAHVSMAALCEFLFSAMPIFVALFGPEAQTPKFRDRYCDFVTDLIVGLAD